MERILGFFPFHLVIIIHRYDLFSESEGVTQFFKHNEFK